MNSDDDQSSVSSESSRTRSIKGSFRKRLKSIGSASERSRSIIEGTKAVSSNIVNRALRRRTSSDIRNIKEENPTDDLSIFPASEIFDAIQFAFPPLRVREISDFGSKSSLEEDDIPPPQYPPPPPPAEFFEDIFSDQSSNSYSDNLSEKNKNDSTDAAEKYDLYDKYSSFENDSETRSISPYDLKNVSDLLSGDAAMKTILDSFFQSSSETGSSGNSVEAHSFEYVANKNSYENWNLQGTPENASPESWKSVIKEFDPIYDAVCSEGDDVSLSGIDLFGSVLKKSEDSVTKNADSPPSDNHFVEVIDANEPGKKQKRKYSLRRNSSVSTWSNMKRALEAVSSSSNWSPNVIRRVSHSFHKESGPLVKMPTDLLIKPDIVSSLTATLHNGYLLKSPSSGEKLKDFVEKWCQLSEGKLYYSPDKNSSKEAIDLNTVMSVCIMQDHKLR